MGIDMDDMMADPADLDEYVVVRNDEEQYSIW
jgi:uncharacterized protein YbdZ (MbtH family)